MRSIEELEELIDNASNQTIYDIALVIHAMYSDKYACSNIDKNFWIENLKDGTHIKCHAAYSLILNMSSHVSLEFSKRSSYWDMKAYNEKNLFETLKYSNKAKKLFKISIDLKDMKFKESLLNECKYLFYRDNI